MWDDEPMTIKGIGKLIPDWIWWIIIAFFGLFVLLGLVMLVEAIIFSSNAVRTKGEVISFSRDYLNDEGVTYKPVIRYRREDGRIFEAKTRISSSSYDYAVGDQVNILYTYDKPQEVGINHFFSIFGPGFFNGLFGALFIVLSVWARDKVMNSVETSWTDDASVIRMQEAAIRQRARGYRAID